MTLSFPFIFILYLSRAADTDDTGLSSSRVVSQWLCPLHRDYPYFGVLNTLAGYLKKNIARASIPARRKDIQCSLPVVHSHRESGQTDFPTRAFILTVGRPQSA